MLRAAHPLIAGRLARSLTTMTNMRAVIVKDGKGPIENLYIGEIEKPSPRKHEVLVEVCSLMRRTRSPSLTSPRSRHLA